MFDSIAAKLHLRKSKPELSDLEKAKQEPSKHVELIHENVKELAKNISASTDVIEADMLELIQFLTLLDYNSERIKHVGLIYEIIEDLAEKIRASAEVSERNSLDCTLIKFLGLLHYIERTEHFGLINERAEELAKRIVVHEEINTEDMYPLLKFLNLLDYRHNLSHGAVNALRHQFKVHASEMFDWTPVPNEHTNEAIKRRKALKNCFDPSWDEELRDLRREG